MSVEEILKIISKLPSQDQEPIAQRIIEQDDISKQSDIYNIRVEIHESNPIQWSY